MALVFILVAIGVGGLAHPDPPGPPTIQNEIFLNGLRFGLSYTAIEGWSDDDVDILIQLKLQFKGDNPSHKTVLKAIYRQGMDIFGSDSDLEDMRYRWDGSWVNFEGWQINQVVASHLECSPAASVEIAARVSEVDSSNTVEALKKALKAARVAAGYFSKPVQGAIGIAHWITAGAEDNDSLGQIGGLTQKNPVLNPPALNPRPPSGAGKHVLDLGSNPDTGPKLLIDHSVDNADGDDKCPAERDLSIEKEATSQPCVAGQPCTFKVSVTNHSNEPYEGSVHLQDRFTGNPDSVSWDPISCTKISTNGQLRCRQALMKIGPNKTASFTLKLTYQEPGEYRNCAMLLVNQMTIRHDTDSANNEECVNFAVQQKSTGGEEDSFDLKLEKRKSGVPLCKEGETCDFGVDVVNNGPTQFEGKIIIEDKIGPKASFFDHAPRQWQCNGSGAKVTCTSPELTLEPGEALSDQNLGLGLTFNINKSNRRLINEACITDIIDMNGQSILNKETIKTNNCEQVKVERQNSTSSQSSTTSQRSPVSSTAALSSADQSASAVYEPLGQALDLLPQIEAEPGNPGDLSDQEIREMRRQLQEGTLGLAQAIGGAMIEEAAGFEGIDRAISLYENAREKLNRGNVRGALSGFREAFSQAVQAQQTGDQVEPRHLPFQVILIPDFVSVRGKSQFQIAGVILGARDGSTEANGNARVTVDGPTGIRSQVQHQGNGLFGIAVNTAELSPGSHKIRVQVQAGSRSTANEVELSHQAGQTTGDSGSSGDEDQPEKVQQFDENDSCIIEDPEFFNALDQWVNKEISNALFFATVDAWAQQTNVCSASASARVKTLNLESVTSQTLPSRDAIDFVAQGTGIHSLDLDVYNLGGGLVFSGRSTGSQLRWPLQTNDGRPVPNGVYLYRVAVEGPTGDVQRSDIKKLIVLR